MLNTYFFLVFWLSKFSKNRLVWIKTCSLFLYKAYKAFLLDIFWLWIIIIFFCTRHQCYNVVCLYLPEDNVKKAIYCVRVHRHFITHTFYIKLSKPAFRKHLIGARLVRYIKKKTLRCSSSVELHFLQQRLKKILNLISPCVLFDVQGFFLQSHCPIYLFKRSFNFPCSFEDCSGTVNILVVKISVV